MIRKNKVCKSVVKQKQNPLYQFSKLKIKKKNRKREHLKPKITTQKRTESIHEHEAKKTNI